MLLLVRGLIESQLAAVHRTYVGFLLSVYSEVIEQVVPLPEDLATVWEITGKNIRCPTRTRLVKFHMGERAGRGDMHFTIKD